MLSIVLSFCNYLKLFGFISHYLNIDCVFRCLPALVETALVYRDSLFAWNGRCIIRFIVVLFRSLRGNLRRDLVVGGFESAGVRSLPGYRVVENEQLSLGGLNFTSGSKLRAKFALTHEVHVGEALIIFVVFKFVHLSVILIKLFVNLLEVFKCFETFLKIGGVTVYH